MLQEPLGSGAYGEVWRARLTDDSVQQVALKFLHTMVASTEAQHRFSVEMRALELLRENSYIVQFRSYGQHRGRSYLAMEYIDGIPLDRWIREQSRPPALSSVFSLFQEICAALGAAHNFPPPLGPITHRDLKPSNIMLRADADGQFHVKVLDFGMARVGPRQHTRTGAQLGTTGYMPPEQAQGDCSRLSPASDVFALGILLIEMLTLRNRGPDRTPLASYVVQEGANLRHFLSSLRADVPQAVWEVIARAVRPCVTDRFRSADQLWSALSAALLSSTIEHATVLRELVTMRSVPALAIADAVPPARSLGQVFPTLDLVLSAVAVYGASGSVPLAVAVTLASALAPHLLRWLRARPGPSPLERALSSAHRREIDRDRARIEHSLVAWCRDFSETNAYALSGAYAVLPLGETVLPPRQMRLLLSSGVNGRETRVQRVARILSQPKQPDSLSDLQLALLPPPPPGISVYAVVPTAAHCESSR
ncbi:MAG: serine/threonine-protein kinase [Polyangia bacterium]